MSGIRDTIADGHRETTAAHEASVTAVALSWLRAQPVVGAPIASARTLAHLPGLFERVDLTADELAQLSEATAR